MAENPPTSPEQETLQRVIDSVVDDLGFGAACINLVVDGGTVLQVVAFAGPPEAAEHLLGARIPWTTWEQMLAGAEGWGRLLFIDGRQDPVGFPNEASWVFDRAIDEGLPDAWRPGDELFVPLESSSGELLGVLSVDLPPGGRRPDVALRHSLESFGLTASMAVEQTRLHHEARASARLLRTLLDASPLGLALVDDQRLPVTVNPAYDRLVGQEHEVVVKTAFDGLTARGHLEALDSRGHSHEVRLDDGTGGRRWVRVRAVELAEPRDRATHLLQVEDVTESHRAARRLRYAAEHDALTKLPNRARVLEHLERALVAQAVDGREFAVLYCDLDRFKPVNDSYGHAVGDQYLRAVARRMQARLRDSDVIGRFGGDEFVVVTGPLETREVCQTMAERLMESVADPVQVGELTFTPAMSIGIAVAMGHDETSAHLLHRADSALYRAKHDGGSRVRQAQD